VFEIDLAQLSPENRAMLLRETFEAAQHTGSWKVLEELSGWIVGVDV
jgi:hypothetical protein